MTSVFLDLSDCCNYIDSSKLTERKKRVEELRTFLQSSVVIKHLNSERGIHTVQWNDLYQAVHRSVLKEGERYFEEEAKGKNTSSSLTAIKNCSSLLLLVASKANADKARLSCRDLVSSVLEILENDYLKRILSATYLKILNQFILLKKRYWGDIVLSQWIELLDTILPMFNEANSEKDKSDIICALDQISLHGARLADFIPHCKKLLKCLPDIIKDVVFSQSSLLQSNVIQLAVTLCQQLKKEYRLFICKFGEEILCHLIKMIESRTGDVFKKKEMIAKLVLELIAVHHPCGALPRMPGSMVASSWDSWITNLHGLFCCLQNELDTLGHSAPVSNNPPIVLLAVSVVKLIMNEVDDEVDSTILDVTGEMSFSSPAVKRRRLTTRIVSVVDNIRSKKRLIEAWPWFLFLELLLTKHPDILKESDFISIFQMISDYLGSSVDKYINVCLWRCAKNLLFAEKLIKDSLKTDEKVLENLWANIWSTALRDFTRSEINYDPVALHSFIQSALNVNCFPEHAESLLKLYTNQVIIDLPEEVNTLRTLTTRIIIPDSSNLKKSLLELLLKKCTTKNCSYAVHCSEALFGLLLKSKSPISIEQKSVNCWEDLDIFYMTTSLETPPSLSQTFNGNNGKICEVSVIEDKNISQELVKMLNTLNIINDSSLLYYNVFLYRLHHLLTIYNLSIQSDVNQVFQNSIDNLWLHLEKGLNDCDINVPIELIEEFNKFIVIISECPVIFRNRSFSSLAKSLFEIIERQKEKPPFSSQTSEGIEDNEDKERKSNTSSLELTILQLLVNIGYVEGVCIEKNIIHNNLMNYCSHNLDIRTVDGFQIAITIINQTVKLKFVSDNVLQCIINLLRELCIIWYKQLDEFSDILKAMTDCIKPLYNSESPKNHSNFCQLVGSCSDKIFSKHYGPRLVGEFTTLIGTMTKVDIDCKWKFSFRSDEPELYLRFHILELLRSKFNEVRTNASNYIADVFENESNSLMKSSMQVELFNKIIGITEELFKVKGNLSEADVEEEGMIITSSVLRILLNLVLSSCHWRRKSLYVLFKIIRQKNINNVLVQKILKQIETELHLNNVIIFIEQNLDFIALSWYMEYHNFKEFPYNLLACSSRKIFYTEYKTCIVPILLEKGDENSLKEICAEIENNEKRIVEECFPEAISCFLPRLGDIQTRHIAQAMYFLIEKIIGGETFKDLLSSELDKVLVALHEKLHDEAHFKKLCDNNLTNLEFPQRTSSHILVNGIIFTLDYLQKTSPDTSIPLLVFLCKEYSSHIHHMLHNLTSNISEATTNEIRLLCFHQYATLCDNLANSIADLGTVSGYIIRSVVHTLLYLTDTKLAAPSLCFMNRFLSMCLPHSADIVNDLLHVIVSKLVPNVNEKTIEGKTCLQIFKLLIIEYKDSLPAVSDLDRLPDDPLFTQFACSTPRDTLLADLEHFLKVNEHQVVDLSTREHGLRHLHQQLISRKTELIELYADLKNMRGFAEDCAQSVLHRVTSSLVYLATSNNLTIKEIAGKCLGELGLRDLSTLALKPECSEKTTSLSSALVSILLPLTVHKNPNIAEQCCEVLCSLLMTKEGYEAAGKLSQIETSYLSPFINTTSRMRRPYSVDMCKDSLERAMNYWCPQKENQSHFSWISELVTALLLSFKIESSFWRLLIPVVKHEVKVAETLLPYITYIILTEEDLIIPLLEEKMNLFFKNHFQLHKKLTNQNENNGVGSIYMNRASLQCMLSVVNFYRQKEMNAIQRLKHNLKLNFLHVAQAAQYCRAYFTSVLYAELWTNTAVSSLERVNIKQRSPPLELVYEYLPEDGVVLQTLLWDAYKEIGETDAVYGCGNIHLHDPNSRIKYYKQFGLWSRIIDECELSRSKLYDQDLIEALKMSGQYLTAMRVSADKIEYDCAWRLGNWTLDVPLDDSPDYNSLLYGALKSVKVEDNSSLKIFVDKARMIVLESLQNASLEVANSIYLPLSRLQALNEIEYFYGSKKSDEIVSDTNYCTRWELLEPILIQRALLMDPAPHIWLDAAKIQAKHSSSNLLAQSYLEKIMSMGTTGNTLHEAKLQEAELVWSSGEFHRAKYLLKKFIAANDDLNHATLSTALLTYGRWIAETKSDKPTSIIQKYFQKAATLCEESTSQRLAAADCLARYADSEFQRKQQYLRSEGYANKIQNIDISHRKYEELQVETDKEKVKPLPDRYKAIETYKKQAQIDKGETEIVQKELTAYLRLAVREYMNCLILGNGDSNDLKMFRLVSLWLDNVHHQGLQIELDSHIYDIATNKFLPVLPQLAVRIKPMDGSHFISTLQKLLIRCCEDHPYHSLPLLLALANSEKDEEFLQQNGNTSKKKRAKSPEARVSGAKELLELMIERGKIDELIKLLQLLSHAYISLAYSDNPKKNKGDYKIPSSQPIRKLKRLANIPCITQTLAVDKSAKYSNIIGIEKFDDVYTLVGGVNEPKKVRCLCTDGVYRDQLIKGKDDLRQDAVMQQVFTVMNTLLRSDEKTAHRKLTIRTYKVVPLSQRSGVIEWVKDTDTFGRYLVDAHPKYRPKDLTPNECRHKLCQIAKSTKEEKIQTFKEICTRMKPVFRHFFFEKYNTPGKWFERRLAYTKSVATNSMIGYILGIGDRHVINILIDQTTAEMVHIDFGIAFEQGRILPTPETVPFRLTRDVVDGMGVSGVEGIYKRCCEETMTLLRKCKEPILTTLEVLLYDPLYTWTITPKQALSLQEQDTIQLHSEQEDVNNDRNIKKRNTLAERALQRLKEKLEGFEDGSYTSVEGQINSLMRMARDTSNLAQLYFGWQAYL